MINDNSSVTVVAVVLPIFRIVFWMAEAVLYIAESVLWIVVVMSWELDSVL